MHRERGWRRKQKQRLKQHRLTILRDRHRSFNAEYYDEEFFELQSQVDVRTKCSCNMCGNPRKHYNEITKQEKVANDIDIDQLDPERMWDEEIAEAFYQWSVELYDKEKAA